MITEIQNIHLDVASSPVFDNINKNYVVYQDFSVNEVPAQATHFQCPFIKFDSEIDARSKLNELTLDLESLNPGKVLTPKLAIGNGRNIGFWALSITIY